MFEKADTVYWVILASFVMPVLLSIVLIWFFLSYQRKKFQNEVYKKDSLLREQQLIIEKHQAIESERARIASEMHDDLGSGLTTIRYLSDKALQQAGSNEEAVEIRKISAHSNTLVRNMSEIIWAMNARFDTTESLTGYLRRYASEYLDDLGIPYTFESPDDIISHAIGGEKRRNIFLVFKEALHNSTRHSGASRIDITIRIEHDFEIHIAEIGAKGFVPAEGAEGNGLFNSRKRMDTIEGSISYAMTEAAMHIIITVPIQANVHG